MNENGQHLPEFCCYYGLCVSNMLFNKKPQHTVSWRHRRSKHWHQLDLILIRCSSLPSITITHSYQSADSDTDHSLMCSRIKLRTKRLYHTKKEGIPHIDISKTCNQRKVEEFAQTLEETLPGPVDANAPERWEHFKNAVYNTVLSTFGKKTKKTADWFEAHLEELMPAIEDKRRSLAAYKACLSEYNLQPLRAAHSQVQQAARRCSNDYWLQLCSCLLYTSPSPRD